MVEAFICFIAGWVIFAAVLIPYARWCGWKLKEKENDS